MDNTITSGLKSSNKHALEHCMLSSLALVYLAAFFVTSTYTPFYWGGALNGCVEDYYSAPVCLSTSR